MSLVTPVEFSARIGFDVTGDARALAMLADAEAAVKSYTGQQFEISSSTFNARVPNKRGVLLHQMPVRSVDSVTDLNGNAVHYVFDGIDRVMASTSPLNSFEVHMPHSGWPNVIKITYTHGYTNIPDDIVAVVCQVAGRGYGVLSTDTGINQETIGAYNYSTGAAASSGAVGLLLPERSILDRYVRPGSSFEVSR